VQRCADVDDGRARDASGHGGQLGGCPGPPACLGRRSEDRACAHASDDEPLAALASLPGSRTAPLHAEAEDHDLAGRLIALLRPPAGRHRVRNGRPGRGRRRRARFRRAEPVRTTVCAARATVCGARPAAVPGPAGMPMALAETAAFRWTSALDEVSP
jgi:hypothetical protein